MAFTGHVIGISMDPFLIIPALLAGIFLRSWMIPLVTLAVATILTLTSTGMPLYWILPRFVGGTIIAFAFFGLRKLITHLTNRKGHTL